VKPTSAIIALVGPLLLGAAGCGPAPRVADNDGGAAAVASGSVDDRLSDIVEIQLYEHAACARNSGGEVFCWGDQYAAADVEGGSPALGRSNRPRKIHGVEGAVRLSSVENRFGYATAVLADGAIVAWPHVDMRPFMAFPEPVGDEKGAKEDQLGDIARARKMRRKPAANPWQASATGLRVEAIDIYADTGCFYARGELSCPRLPWGVNVANYDALESRSEPGLIDVVIVNEIGPGACLLFEGGRLECRDGDSRHIIELPSPVRALFGGYEAVVHLKDGRVARISDNNTLVFDEGIPRMEHVDGDGGGSCGVTTDHTAICWSVSPDRPARIRPLTGVEHPVRVQTHDATWCVLEASGHVKCGGLNGAGQCGVGYDSLDVGVGYDSLSVEPLFHLAYVLGAKTDGE